MIPRNQHISELITPVIAEKWEHELLNAAVEGSPLGVIVWLSSLSCMGNLLPFAWFYCIVNSTILAVVGMTSG